MAMPLIFTRSFVSGAVSAPSTGRLAGRVAVVSASTAGIGFAIARRLGQEGAAVVVSSRKQDRVDEAVDSLKKDGIKVHGIACHVGNKEMRENLLKEAVSTFGGLDILVSNAAANPHYGPITSVGEDHWNKIFDTNVKASFFLAQEAHKYLSKSNCGPSITFVASIAGYEALPLLGVYSVSKTALLALPQVMAREFSPVVRVNAVAPGIVKTDFSRALWQNEKTLKKFSTQVPLGCIAQPEQIASTVAFLCSDDASYITGETISVAGGMRSRL